MEYASWGDYKLNVLNWLGHKENNTYAWAKIETAKAPSTMQFMGTELRSISVQVQWHYDTCDVDPKEEYENLKKAAAKGEPYKLIVGTKLYGDFIIESINAGVIQTDPDGNTIMVQADIAFTEYVHTSITRKKVKSIRPGVVSSSGSTGTATGTGSTSTPKYKVVVAKKKSPDDPTYTSLEEIK